MSTAVNLLRQYMETNKHGPHRSPEEEFLNILNIILLFCLYLPLERGVALHSNKFESPPLKQALYQVWLKLAQWW